MPGNTKMILLDANGKPAPQWFNPVADQYEYLVMPHADSPVTDPTLSGSEVALLKGLLKQLQGNGSGAAPVNLAGSNTADHTFHDASAAAADGTAFVVGGYKTLVVEIYGDSASRTIEFKATGPNGAPRSVIGINLGTMASAVNTAGTGELWQFDVTGLASILMDLTAVAGGSVTIKGKAVT